MAAERRNEGTAGPGLFSLPEWEALGGLKEHFWI